MLFNSIGFEMEPLTIKIEESFINTILDFVSSLKNALNIDYKQENAEIIYQKPQEFLPWETEELRLNIFI